MRKTFTGLVIVWTFLVSCGSFNKNDNSDSEKKDDPSLVSAGNCVLKDKEGCIGGFISHGQKITISLLDSGDKITFRDAADIYDRFSEAFVEPAIKNDGRNVSDYDISLVPEVKRDNFAIGFYMFLEGTKAYDKKNIDAVGNFSYDGLDSGTYTFRMVKEITLSQKNKTSGESLDQCLVFEYQREDVLIDTNDSSKQIFQLGSVNEFDFYVRRNYGKCSGSKDLPPIGPSIIPVENGKKEAKILGNYQITEPSSIVDMTFVGDKFYFISQDCTDKKRTVGVFDKTSQTQAPSLSLSGPCDQAVHSIAGQNDNLYVISGTSLYPITLSDTAAVGTEVSLSQIGYSSGQLTGGVIESGIFYAMEAKQFKSNKIIAFSLSGAASPAISLTGSDGSQLVGLTKLGALFYSVKAGETGKATILAFSTTGELKNTYYLVNGLTSDEKAMAIESDGTSLWLATNKGQIYNLSLGE